MMVLEKNHHSATILVINDSGKYQREVKDEKKTI